MKWNDFTKEKISEILEKLDFVNWDRYFEQAEGVGIFGWIDREKDSHKDFVFLQFVVRSENSLEVGFSTSSKKYSKHIAQVFNLEHSDCKRVENFFDIPNVIKINQIE